LFDVLPHPDFSNNQLVYLSYSAGSADANATTVARGRLTRASLEDVSVIFSATPTKYAPLHYGGRLAWADSQHLLLTTGDGFDFREKAQDRGSHLGKTLRMRDDGTAPAQSPFPDHPYVWTYGHRNPQGLAVSRSGTVYQHEHGPRGGDEVNVLTPGTNYGWPVITDGMDYNGAYVSPFTAYQGMAQPAHVWVPSIAPSGLMVYEGSLFPAWQGDLFVGALVDNEVRRLEVEGDEIVAEQALFAELNRRIRDVRESPDGSIYIITDGPSGQIVRVTPGE
jgi:glucose/arabinose dehydrogenase